jgi:SAM-dependent methyltransferase
MLPIHKIVWHEWREKRLPIRIPESEAMTDPEQIRSYVKAYEWGGPTSALQLFHLQNLSSLIRPGDCVLDLACGPGPLLLELAPLYPDCRFIGADLSRPMLDVLEESCHARRIENIETLHEDIRHLPSLNDGTVDMVISTSALHHLPDLEGLAQVFKRASDLLKTDGGVYMFDFGQIRSERVRDILVADIAGRAPPLTAQDYAQSLNAAFPISDVAVLARRFLPASLVCRSSRFVDFFYFMRTVDRCAARESVLGYIRSTLARCGMEAKIELRLLSSLSRVL